MHIVQLSTCLEYYGGEVCLANLACGFADRGHQVSCLVKPGSDLRRELEGGAVEVVPMPLVDWYDPGTIHRVRQWLRQYQPDILATHLPRDYFIAATASRGLPVCNIATRHRLRPLSLALLKRPFMRSFGAMIAVSEAVAAGVRQARLVPADRVVTVPNGIAAPLAGASADGLRQRAGIAPDTPMVGLVGKLCPEKGAAFLLRAASLLGKGMPDLQVVLVGSGGEDGYRAHLENLTKNLGLSGRVHFVGYVPDVAGHIHEFDVLVVPSDAEPFGLVTLEAMASAVPVIATDSGGSPEIITDGVEGFLVPAGEAVALANRLSRLLESRELRTEMGDLGQARHLAQFTLNHMLNGTEKVYREALNRRGSAMMAAQG